MNYLWLTFLITNLALFFFNLIPIPPLDGSRVLAAIMPRQWLDTFYRLEPFGFIIIVSIEMIGAQISKMTGYEVSLFYYFVQIPIHGILELFKL
jgi:Zn-dependent protease